MVRHHQQRAGARNPLEFLGPGFPGDAKCLQQSASRVPAFGHGAHGFQRFTQPVHSEESLDGGFHRIEEATEGLLEQTRKSGQFVAGLGAHTGRRFFRVLSQPDAAWFQRNKHQVKSAAQAVFLIAGPAPMASSTPRRASHSPLQ